ncbi:MAG: GAF domain-containing protein [Deltaproteobacteria bacterium]|nr:GAF domain-containing protein [Deltaproteobacteria bacterium]MBW2118662.1 GAF domain-containing protein [Deltaproteobacteria bacterium]MBW2342774.1 GAF domain-containing protein [Deltaproteobacteria bacterium]
MEKHYKERFEAQRRLAEKIAPFMEVNDILETMRAEIRVIVPTAMEACILLLDPDAQQYTRPLQCALYDKPVNCLSCKRNRSAIRKAINQRKGVVVSSRDPIVRHDGSKVQIGPEAAIPVIVNDKVLAAVSVVAKPGTRFTRKDFYMIRDFAETLRNVLANAKNTWEITQEKIRISQMLTHLSPFVPESVRNIVEKNPEMLKQEKEKKDVSVLFLDLEGYTRLSASRSETEVNELVEKMFSSFVDPIHRSHGDINETAGDGLMIIFKDHDSKTNAVNSVKAAFDIFEQNREINRHLAFDLEPINVNIGINSGTALVGMTRFKGSLGTRMTYTASGPVTNLAARLASHATGGDILIGDETKNLINGLWPLYDRGSAKLKGIEEPLRVFSLLRKE